MKKQLSLLAALVGLCSLSLQAAEPTMANRRTASNYYAYPIPEIPAPQLTAAPEGYEPFHMEHYGRHGSRWHIGEWVYVNPVKNLLKAQRNGQLTPKGEKLLAQLQKIEMDYRGHDGELTAKGARQHRGIAQRMTANFPQLFEDGAWVNARSTDVMRCVLSMANEVEELKAFNPEGLNIVMDGSRAYVPYLNFEDPVANEATERARKHLKPLNPVNRKMADKWVLQFIKDPQFIADSIPSKDLFNDLFRLAANTQSHDDQPSLYEYFTDDELYSKWRYNNANYFLRFGNTPLTDNLGPRRQRFLLRNWIESADSSLAIPGHVGANLRFGHEVALMPMVCLLNINGYGNPTSDLENLDQHWKNIDIFPMGSNIQMIFYRPVGKKDFKPEDVLVKVLLNEGEGTLPTQAVSGPYYRWSDLRRYYLDLLGPDGGVIPPAKPLSNE